MTRLTWADQVRTYESGISKGVLYFDNYEASVWSGLISLRETGISSDVSYDYFDGLAYNVSMEFEEYIAEIEAFVYPYVLEDHILALCDSSTRVGTTNDLRPFGFTYRTNASPGYKLHIVYNIVGTINDMTYDTLNDDISLNPFVFNFHAIPVPIPKARPSSHLIIDSNYADPGLLAEVEKILYGSEQTTPRFPSVEEILNIFGV